MKGLWVTVTRRSVALIATDTFVITLTLCLGTWMALNGDAANLIRNGALPKALLITLVLPVVALLRRPLRAACDRSRRQLVVGIATR